MSELSAVRLSAPPPLVNVSRSKKPREALGAAASSLKRPKASATGLGLAAAREVGETGGSGAESTDGRAEAEAEAEAASMVEACQSSCAMSGRGQAAQRLSMVAHCDGDADSSESMSSSS